MIELFNSPISYVQGSLSPAGWPYVENGLKRNLEQVKNYYYVKPFAVKSNHILIRLLNNLGVPFNYNLERFADIVDAKAFHLAMGLKMSSPIYRGNIFRDIFYGGDIDEVIVAIDDYFDVYEAQKNWKTLSAVKVIYHPKSDLNLLLPNGKYIGNESGTAVIGLNIALLAVQFRSFLFEELKVLQAGESPKSVAQFIHMYVLPNMLDSHLDIALFNRAYNLLNNQPMGLSYKKHVFHITDYSSRVDDIYSNIIAYYKGSDRKYFAILQGFPVPSAGDFAKALILPDNAPTKQSIWTNVVARLTALDFLVKIAKDHGNRLDKTNNNMIARYFKLYENDRALDSILLPRSQLQNKLLIQDILGMIAA